MLNGCISQTEFYIATISAPFYSPYTTIQSHISTKPATSCTHFHDVAETDAFSLRSQKELRQKYKEFDFTVHQEFSV